MHFAIVAFIRNVLYPRKSAEDMTPATPAKQKAVKNRVHYILIWKIVIYRKSFLEVFCKEAALKDFAKFKEKQL